MPEASVLIVCSEGEVVEADLAAGRVGCPSCEGCLARWGFGRWRTLRAESGSVALRPRRARCRLCRSTHVLLPDVVLARRADTVAVIGTALTMAATGDGYRKAATRLGRPSTTVRGWFRRFRASAARVAEHFAAWACRFDPMLALIEPAGSPVADAVEAVGVAARAASLRLGPRPPWSWVSVLTVGGLLANTTSPWLAP
ncbi:MAG: DUF6431 domain-containing protein [Acidimicrobiales bacterium]